MVFAYVTDHPGCSKTKAVNGCLGNGVGKQNLEEAVKWLIRDGTIERSAKGRLNVAV